MSVEIPVINTYLMSSYGLGANSGIFNLVAISLIFIQQLVEIYTPYFYSVIAFISLLLPFNKEQPEVDPIITKYVEEKLANKEEPIILENYRNFIDDRKAKKGSINDIQKLKKYGFKKFRLVSKEFAQILHDQIQQQDDSSTSRRKK